MFKLLCQTAKKRDEIRRRVLYKWEIVQALRNGPKRTLVRLVQAHNQPRNERSCSNIMMFSSSHVCRKFIRMLKKLLH
uniref:Uncharacterized protein n=1 Tax=Arundo donax TaxID=35708 RepID=A0A0A9HQS1_ARUDO